MATATPPTPGATTATPELTAAPELTTTARQRLLARVRDWRARHARREMVFFLLAGFVFDAVTLSRIDDWATLAQQGVSLAVLGGLLLLDGRYGLGLWEPPPWLARWWHLSEDAIHFLFGSLLSSFALFYFKSASLLTSFAFLGLLFGLLVLNELPRFRALGPVMRVALFSLSVTSYLAYLLPVLAGMVRPWLFVLAVLLASGLLVWAFRAMARASGDLVLALKHILAPGLAMQALLLACYFLRIMPPVPLAMEQMGIYHEVKRVGGNYVLAHQRPEWRVWHQGDQEFLARPGDKIYAFARIFAPSRFSDQVVARWYYDDPERGWVPRGHKTLAVRGAGDRGYRTYSYMSYRDVPGDYRVDITTQDGHVIGQLHFTVVPDPSTGPREWRYDQG